MTRRMYKFLLKTQKEVSFIGTRYYPVEIDPSLSPYATVLATIWDEDHMVGQVNQTEILAWWSEAYQEPAETASGQLMDATNSKSSQLLPLNSEQVLAPQEYLDT